MIDRQSLVRQAPASALLLLSLFLTISLLGYDPRGPPRLCRPSRRRPRLEPLRSGRGVAGARDDQLGGLVVLPGPLRPFRFRFPLVSPSGRHREGGQGDGVCPRGRGHLGPLPEVRARLPVEPPRRRWGVPRGDRGRLPGRTGWARGDAPRAQFPGSGRAGPLLRRPPGLARARADVLDPRVARTDPTGGGRSAGPRGLGLLTHAGLVGLHSRRYRDSPACPHRVGVHQRPAQVAPGRRGDAWPEPARGSRDRPHPGPRRRRYPPTGVSNSRRWNSWNRRLRSRSTSTRPRSTPAPSSWNGRYSTSGTRCGWSRSTPGR